MRLKLLKVLKKKRARAEPVDNPHSVPRDQVLPDPPDNAGALAMFCVGIPDAKNRRSAYRRTGWTLRALGGYWPDSLTSP